MPPEQGGNTAAMLAALVGKGSAGGLAGLAGSLLGTKNNGALFVALLRSGTVNGHLIERFDLQRVYHKRYREDAAKQLARLTKITEDPKSGVITIAVTDETRERARDLAQGYLDELNNLATSTCSQASTIACPIHAGWEADSSTSTATNTQTCSNGSIGWQKSYIGDPLDAETDRRKGLPAGSASDYSSLIDALRSKAGESSTSRYADRGYAKDKPPAHTHGGYDQP